MNELYVFNVQMQELRDVIARRDRRHRLCCWAPPLASAVLAWLLLR